MSDTDKALHALLRLQKRIIGRGSGASCCTDVKIVKIREDFKTIKDTLAKLVAERDEARREVCVWVEMDGATTAKEEAGLRDWDCFKEDGK